MSGYISNYRANKHIQKKKKAKRQEQIATGATPISSSGVQAAGASSCESSYQ